MINSFNPWDRKVPRDSGQLSPHATMLKPVHPGAPSDFKPPTVRHSGFKSLENLKIGSHKGNKVCLQYNTGKPKPNMV